MTANILKAHYEVWIRFGTFLASAQGGDQCLSCYDHLSLTEITLNTLGPRTGVDEVTKKPAPAKSIISLVHPAVTSEKFSFRKIHIISTRNYVDSSLKYCNVYNHCYATGR